MILNAVIGAISTLVLFFLQAKLPMAGLDKAFLGPALFVMGLGAALGSKVVEYFPKWRYFFSIILSEFLKNRVALQFVSQSVRKSISAYLKTGQTAEGSVWCQ